MISTLGQYLEMRNYPAFENTIEKALKEHSWEELLGMLREVQDAKRLAIGWNIPLAPGKMREGMIHILRIQDMIYLDIDFLDAFKHLQGSNLEEIRKGVREYCISLLREQIRRGNTFFIDAEVLKETALTVLVPGILEARIEEIENLETNPPLSDVYSTYYGFSILTSGGLSADLGGIPPATKAQLTEAMQQVGNVENISAKQLKFSYLSFGNCSDNLKTLLWNLLKMCIGGIKSQKAGIDILGNLGDTRALDLMHLRLENVNDGRVKETLFDSISRIGSVESYELILAQIDSGSNVNAVKALGSIRDARVRDVLKKYRDRYYREAQQYFLEALGNTRDTYWIPYLNHQVYRNSRSKSVANIAIQKIKAVEKYHQWT